MPTTPGETTAPAPGDDARARRIRSTHPPLFLAVPLRTLATLAHGSADGREVLERAIGLRSTAALFERHPAGGAR